MTSTTCGCGRPISDSAYLCSGCSTRLARDLGDIPSLSEDLEVTRTRQSRTGGPASGVTSRTSETQLPWSEPAAEAVMILRSTLVAWCLLIVEERGITHPTDSAPAMSRFLLLHLEWLRHHPDAGEAADELTHAVDQARRVVDRRPDRLYAGPCDPTGEFHEPDSEQPGPCATDLYANEGKAEVTCPRCQLVWTVASRREHLLESAQGQLVTASDLSRFLSAYGEPLTAERIWQWASRGHLVARGHDQAGRPLYRVGDASDVLSRISELRKKSA